MSDEAREQIREDIKTAAETLNLSAQLIAGNNGFVSRDAVFETIAMALIGIGQALTCIAMQNQESMGKCESD